jgi:tRNA-splicing ligase RtcB
MLTKKVGTNAVMFGEHEEGTIRQLSDVAGRAERAALLADGHVGFTMPIGGVAAYRNKVSVVGVGFDVGCGNAAIRTDLRVEDITRNVSLEEIERNPHRLAQNNLANNLADEIASTISFGIGRKNNADDAPVDHPLFLDPAWYAVPNTGGYRETLQEKARRQLGTVGSGNHYVDVFADESGAVWVGVHFGSRGLGHTIASAYLSLSQGGMWGERAAEKEVLLDINQPLGHDYWQLMQLAGEYAYAGREWVARKVVALLGGKELELVHNHHNFCIPGDQKIATPSGPKRMDEIRAGDTVYSVDESGGLTETSVLRQWHSGRKETLTLRTANRQIRLSDDHPVLTVDVRSEPHPERPWHERTVGQLRWKRAAELTVGEILVCGEGYYQQTDGIGLDLARMVGAFLGDGWVRHSNPEVSGYTVGLAIGAANETHTERYGALVAEQLPGTGRRSNVPGAFGLSCSSVAVWKELERLGLAATSHEKRVPAYAFSLPREEKLALLAGYFDADGSVANAGTSNHGRGTIASVSAGLTEGLRELAIGCGLRVTPIIADERNTNFGPCVVFKCVLSADSVAHLELWHDNKRENARSTRYERSQGLARKRIGYLKLPSGTFAQRIRAIERSTVVEDVYDLTVSHPSHSFVCEGVVVHNCWKEEHTVGTGADEHTEELCVVRKGATPAFPGQKGFVGGSMGDDAVILEGNAAPPDEETALAQRESLFSTVHGAGRVMSRTAAAGKRNRRGKVLSPGRISQEMLQQWLGKRGVILRGGGLDEAPQAYRRLPRVLAAQGDTIQVRHTLRPLIVAMAGAGEVDPKD